MSCYVNANGSGAEFLRDCPDFLARYRDYLALASGKKLVTVSDQILCLREFLRFVHYHTRFGMYPGNDDSFKDLGLADMVIAELVSVDEAFVGTYLTWLDTVAKNGIRTICKKAAYLRQFYNYLIMSRSELGLPPMINPMTNIHFGRVKTESASKVISFNCLQDIIYGANTATANRDRAILLLYATIGMRSSEISRLNHRDLLPGNRLRIPAAENGKERIVCMTPQLQEAMRLYLNALPAAAKFEDRPVFTSSRYPYGRLTVRALCKIVTQAAERAGCGDVTPNDIRETASRSLFHAAPRGGEWAVYALLGLNDKQSNRLDRLRRERKEETEPAFRELILSSDMAALRAYRERGEPVPPTDPRPGGGNGA